MAQTTAARERSRFTSYGCDNYTGVGRIVGLDVGERRIGVAVSDPTRTLARPLTALRTTGLDGDALKVSLNEVGRLGGEEPLEAIVVGLPRRLDGSPNEMTPRIERFAARLRDRSGLAVFLQDERLTSVEAESRLARREKSWQARKDRLDAAAAAVILQDYLDNH
jgi:putative Holliday junction resolvase